MQVAVTGHVNIRTKDEPWNVGVWGKIMILGKILALETLIRDSRVQGQVLGQNHLVYDNPGEKKKMYIRGTSTEKSRYNFICFELRPWPLHLKSYLPRF